MNNYKIINKKEIKLLEDNDLINNLSWRELNQYIYSKSFHDLEFFSDIFLLNWKRKWDEYIETPFFHKKIWKALDSWLNTNCIIARWHGKTTAVLIWILKKLIFWEKIFILYVASWSLGEESIWKIKLELETNQNIKNVFWELVPINKQSIKEKKSKKWRQKELELMNWNKIQTLSKGMTARGKRPNYIIFDDPQENKDVENKAIVEKFNNWVFSSLYNTLLPWWSMFALWTVIWNLCLVKHLRDEKKWETIEYEACDYNFNKILWPDMWNKEDLIKRKAIIWTSIFNQEFRNIPISKENTIIKKHWIRYHNNSIKSFDSIIMAIDPASTIKEKSDFFAMCICWIIKDKYYILHCDWYKLSPLALISEIVRLNQYYKPNRVIYEKNKEEIIANILKEKTNIPIEKIHAHNDKQTRLQSVAWKIEFWSVYFLQNKNENLIYQLLNFPDVEHDDELDALVYCLLYWGEDDFSWFVY